MHVVGDVMGDKYDQVSGYSQISYLKCATMNDETCLITGFLQNSVI